MSSLHVCAHLPVLIEIPVNVENAHMVGTGGSVKIEWMEVLKHIQLNTNPMYH